MGKKRPELPTGETRVRASVSLYYDTAFTQDYRQMFADKLRDMAAEIERQGDVLGKIAQEEKTGLQWGWWLERDSQKKHVEK